MFFTSIFLHCKVQCWAIVFDAGPTLNQHRINLTSRMPCGDRFLYTLPGHVDSPDVAADLMPSRRRSTDHETLAQCWPNVCNAFQHWPSIGWMIYVDWARRQSHDLWLSLLTFCTAYVYVCLYVECNTLRAYTPLCVLSSLSLDAIYFIYYFICIILFCFPIVFLMTINTFELNLYISRWPCVNRNPVWTVG